MIRYLLARTAYKHLLDDETKLWHTLIEIFHHSSVHSRSKAPETWRPSLLDFNLELLPKILYWIQVGRLARALDNSDTVQGLLIHSDVHRNVCLESLSCWNTHRLQCWIFWQSWKDNKKFFWKFIVPFMRWRSPADEKQRQIVMLPPPYFTAGIVFSSL